MARGGQGVAITWPHCLAIERRAHGDCLRLADWRPQAYTTWMGEHPHLHHTRACLARTPGVIMAGVTTWWTQQGGIQSSTGACNITTITLGGPALIPPIVR